MYSSLPSLQEVGSNAFSLTVKIILLLGKETYKGQSLKWFSIPASIIIQKIFTKIIPSRGWLVPFLET